MTVQIMEGLEGVLVADSQICQIDGVKGVLSYRGLDIGDLAQHSTYEETAYLLWYGDLPTAGQLAAFKARLVTERDLNGSIWAIISSLPCRTQPMETIRTALSAICAYDPDVDNYDREANLNKSIRMTVRLPIAVADYHHFLRGEARVLQDPALDHAANFLYMLRGERATPIEVRALDLAMVLMAEHDFNASTFAARVTASTLSDIYSAIVSAIGTLKGPLHGGANEKAMEMLLEIGALDNVEPYIDAALAAKKRIMGFGHRIYRQMADPRSVYLKEMLRQLCIAKGDMHFYDLATAVDEVVQAKKKIYPNVDFYTAPLLYLLDIPINMFTTVFAISRIVGWTAHVLEQYADNRLIRPLSQYIGPVERTYIPVSDR